MSGSGREPSSSHTMILAAIPVETGTNCSQYSLSAFSFVPLAPSRPQQLHFQKADMNKAHTNTYSIFYGTKGFLRNHFFLFLFIGFVLVVIYREKKNIQVIDFQGVCLSTCFERDLQDVQIAAVNRNKRAHQKYLLCLKIALQGKQNFIKYSRFSNHSGTLQE